MFDLLIFSKDRACQTDLLVRSVRKNIGEQCNMYLLYKASNDDFMNGYQKLFERYDTIMGKKNWVDFVHQGSMDFQTATMNCINMLKGKNLAFAADDNVIYRKAPDDVPEVQRGECFSLRLGFNTLMQDLYNNIYQPPLNHYMEDGNYLYWNAALYNPIYNYGYPMALDCHIYDRRQIHELMLRFDWKNTNQLEGGLTYYRDECLFMSSFTHSISFNIPCNNMSSVTQSGKDFAYSTEDLNRKYLNNEVIDLEKIMDEKIIGAHQECQFFFKPFEGSDLLD
jgi:hypothetical protein